MGSGRLVGRKALITGGDSGIGRAVAIAYAREGADVAITYLPEEAENAAQTVDLVKEADRKAVAIECDLREAEACKETVSRTVSELDGLDTLVNKAGFQWARDHRLEDMDDERFQRILDTNLLAMWRVTKASLEHLSEGASIINVSSIQAYKPSTTMLDYAATKAAVNNFTINLAADLGPAVSAPWRNRPAGLPARLRG